MYRLPSALLFLAIASPACVYGEVRFASEQEVIDAAKRLSAEHCTPWLLSDGMPVAGCTYRASFINAKWGVLVDIMYAGENGNIGFSPGDNYLYLFSPDGVFLERNRGM